MAKIKSRERSTQTKDIIKERSGLLIFFDRHKDLLSYLSIGILLIVAVVILIQINAKTKEKHASQLLGNAITHLNGTLTSENSAALRENTDDSEIEDESIGAFKEILDNYPGTKTEMHAIVLMGAIYLTDGKYDEAIRNFKSFIEKNPDSPLAAEAELGIATALFNKGDIKASLEKIEFIEKHYDSFPMKDVLAYESAKRYEALANWDKARETYEDIIERYPDSPWKVLAEKKLRHLNTEHPELHEEISK